MKDQRCGGVVWIVRLEAVMNIRYTPRCRICRSWGCRRVRWGPKAAGTMTSVALTKGGQGAGAGGGDGHGG